MPEIDRERCRKAAAECVELARATTDPEKKQILLTHAQAWLKLAYAEPSARLERLLALDEAQPYTGTRTIAFRGALAARHVTFGYGAMPVLRDVTLARNLGAYGWVALAAVLLALPLAPGLHGNSQAQNLMLIISFAIVGLSLTLACDPMLSYPFKKRAICFG